MAKYFKKVLDGATESEPQQKLLAERFYAVASNTFTSIKS
jgi:hypothetical protein